jgi:hypothetical protein
MGGKLKSAARTVSDRLGISYQAALLRIRALTPQGLSLEDAVAKILDADKESA